MRFGGISINKHVSALLPDKAWNRVLRLLSAAMVLMLIAAVTPAHAAAGFTFDAGTTVSIAGNVLTSQNTSSNISIRLTGPLI